jgi:hypothetical protein
MTGRIMNTPSLVIGILVIATLACVTVFEVWDRRRRWKWLVKRRLHHRLWLRYAPPERQSQLENFITSIADAWLIPRAKAFALRPSDDLHKLYQHIYKYSKADTFEYEILFEHLEDSGLHGDRIQQPTLRIGDLAREWLELKDAQKL